MKRVIQWQKAVFFCGLLTFAFSILQSQAFASGDEAREASFQQVLERVKEDGRIRVIVGLDVPLLTDVDFQMAADREALIAANERRVATAQEQVLPYLTHIPTDDIVRFRYIPYLSLWVSEDDLLYLRTLPDIVSIEEDIPVAPDLHETTALVGATAAWASNYTGQGWTVAILDSGVDSNHPFMSNKVVSEACYSTNSGTTVQSLCPNGVTSSIAAGSGMDCPSNVSGCGHGTHVAGIAAGANGTFAGQTFHGVARDATIIAIQVFSRVNSTATCGSATPCIRAYSTNIISGLERVFALRNTYNIAAANMSLGGGQHFSQCNTDPRKAIIDQLRGVRIATVIASGNNGYTTSLSAPACIGTAISVGSTTKNNQISSFSNSADFLSILAPGSSIRSSVLGNTYASYNGTSMAAPHVAGAWAIIRQALPQAEVGDILTVLQNTGLSITDTRTGAGNRVKQRISINAALIQLTTNVSGTVTQTNGTPIVGALVRIGSDTVATDEDGNYLFFRGNGTYTVEILPSPYYDFSPSSISVTINNNSQEANFTGVERPNFIIGTGTGSNTPTAYPAPYGNYYWGARHQFLILASELAAAGLSSGDTLTSLGFDVSSLNAVESLQSFRVGLLNTNTASLTATLSGFTQVLNPVTYTPRSGWNPHLFNTPFVWTGENLAVEVCFQNGSFINNGNASTRLTAISGFVPSRIVRADSQGVCNSTLNLTSQNRPNMRFSFADGNPTFSVSGSVFGVAQAGVTLSLAGHGNFTTVGNGAFQFDDVAEGTYTLTPSLQGFTFAPQSRQVTVSATTGNVSGMDFVSSPQTYTIFGRITGVTQSGITVLLNGQFSAVTDVNGDYFFDDLPNGTYTVLPTSSDYVFTPASRQVVINNGNNPGQDFVSTVPTFFVEGMIEGDIQEGVELLLSNDNNHFTDISQPSGEFRIHGVPNGTYTLTPTLLGYEFSPTTQTITLNSMSSSDNNFTATELRYTVAGSITGASVQAVQLLLENNEFSETTTSSTTGNFVFSEIANGSYVLTPSLAGFRFVPASISVNVQFDNIENLSFELMPDLDTLAIPLATGWNMISSNVSSANMSLASLIPSNSALFLLKNNEGEVFIPSFSIVQINEWDVRAGYQAYTNAPDTLVFIGESASSMTISLAAGWNTIAYLRKAPLSVEAALVGIIDNVLLVKNNAGETYLPSFGINSIGQMFPGQGYQVFVTAATVLTYPSGIRTAAEKMEDMPVPGLLPAIPPTEYSATLVLQLRTSRSGEIGAYTERGELVGSGVIHRGTGALTLWGRGEYSLHGANEGEVLSLRFITPTGSEELRVGSLTSLINGESQETFRYRTNEVLLAEAGTDEQGRGSSIAITPNPVGDRADISAYLNGSKARLTVRDAFGRAVLTVGNVPLADGELRYNLQAGQLSSGTYSVEIIADSGTIVIGRFVVIR